MEQRKDRSGSTGRGFSMTSHVFPGHSSRVPELLEDIQAVKVESRGRGLAKLSKPLRRPIDLKKQEEFRKLRQDINYEIMRDKLCQLVMDNKDQILLGTFNFRAQEFCQTPVHFDFLFDMVYSFSVENILHASVGAVVFSYIGSIEVGDAIMKVTLMRKLQEEYEARAEISKSDRERFLVNAFFLCEVLYHVRLKNDECCEVLVEPVINYLDMVLDGDSEKEIKIFTDEFPKVFYYLRMNEPDKLRDLIEKIRTKIISSNLNAYSRASLMKIFELVLNDWSPLPPHVERFYERYL